MVLERIGFGKLLEKNPFKIFNHIYMAVTVVCIWTLFRIESMKAAGEYLKGMFIYQRGEYNLFSCINPEIILLLVTAFLLCGVLQTAVPRLKEALYQKEKVSAVESVGLLAILLLCVVTLSSNSYNPFTVSYTHLRAHET